MKEKKRIATGCIWLMISDNYDYLFINQNISVRPHLESGLSKNIKFHKIKSPRSSFYYEYLLFNSNKSNFKQKIRALISMSKFLFYIDKGFDIKISNKTKLFISLFSLCGLILFICEKINYKNFKLK